MKSVPPGQSCVSDYNFILSVHLRFRPFFSTTVRYKIYVYVCTLYMLMSLCGPGHAVGRLCVCLCVCSGDNF